MERLAPRVGGNLPLRAVDLTDALAVAAALDEADPDVVIHLAAISSTEGAYRDPKLAAAVNVAGTRLLTDWATRHGRRCPVHVVRPCLRRFEILVSRGRSRGPDPGIRPDQASRRARGPGDRPGIGRPAQPAVRIVPVRKRGILRPHDGRPAPATPQSFFTDEFRTPLDYITASRILIRLAESELTGLIHVGGPERLSRFELMRLRRSLPGTRPRPGPR